jgi:hypothetical protein
LQRTGIACRLTSGARGHQIGKGGQNVMRQAGRYRETGEPSFASALRARVFGRDPIPRRALWPAAHGAASTGRTHGRTDQPRRSIQIPLAKGEPSTHGDSRSHARYAMNVSSWGNRTFAPTALMGRFWPKAVISCRALMVHGFRNGMVCSGPRLLPDHGFQQPETHLPLPSNSMVRSLIAR